jgi:Metallo-peptidase family M12B Reprolysin-like
LITPVRAQPGASGGSTFVGHFKGYSDDFRVYVSAYHGAVAGMIRSPEGEFRISPHASAQAGKAILQALSGATLSIVPSVASQLAPTEAAAQAVAPVLADRQKAVANTVIDLMVAYSPAMITRYGSAAGVTARINALVATMNDALTQSQIPLTISLARAEQYAFSESATNATIVASLPGTTLGVQRDASGADLVMAIRPYNILAHGNCGDANLLGVQNGVSVGVTIADAVNAFSSISDGADVAGAGFSCSDLEFAQALGRNLGLQYDRANATGPAATAYGYGYVAPNNAFSTIMALGPNKIARFSNPNVSFNGVATGKAQALADSADSASAIMASMNAVAAFKTVAPSATPVPTRLGDHNADIRADILWRNSATNSVAGWQSGANGASIQKFTSLLPVGPTFKFVTSADIDGDAQAEVLWRNVVNGDLVAWKLNVAGDAVTSSVVVGNAPLEWDVVGVARYPGNVRLVVLRNAVSGSITLWRMNPGALTAFSTNFLGQPVSVENVLSSQGNVIPFPPGDWSLVGITDMYGAGEDNLVFHNVVNGRLEAWQLSAPVGGNSVGFVRANLFNAATIPTGWTVAAVADFQGNSKANFLLRNTATGALVSWALVSGNNSALNSLGNFGIVPPEWQIAGIGDLSGPVVTAGNIRRSDILWRNTITGGVAAWIVGVGGISVESFVNFGVVPLSWDVLK